MTAVNREMVTLAEELIRLGKGEIRMPIHKLSRFSKKMESLRREEIHPGDLIIPLIRELKANVRRSKRFDDIDKEFKLLLLHNKENAYYTLLSYMVFAEKGSMLSKLPASPNHLPGRKILSPFPRQMIGAAIDKCRE